MKFNVRVIEEQGYDFHVEAEDSDKAETIIQTVLENEGNAEAAYNYMNGISKDSSWEFCNKYVIGIDFDYCDSNITGVKEDYITVGGVKLEYKRTNKNL